MFVLIFLLLLGLAQPAHAEDIRFEAAVDRSSVALGESLQLNLSFYGVPGMAVPALPQMPGFNWQYLGPSTKVSIINGQTSSTVTFMYALSPIQTGKLVIPAFSIEYKGNTYTSEAIEVEVAQRGSGGGRLPAAQNPDNSVSEEGLNERVFLTLQADKRRAFVNDPVSVTIKLYINSRNIQDVQYPQLNHENFLLEDFPQPNQYRETLNGIAYDVIEFKTKVFPVREGELTLGPAVVDCSLLVKSARGDQSDRFPFFEDDDFFDSFFGRYQRRALHLKSIDMSIIAAPVPEENKPADFSGALGDYNFTVEANPREVKAGDPVTLKMIVSGTGNFKTVNPPLLNFKDDFKVYDADVKQDNTGKIFEQVIIPKSEKITEIPEIGFSFFDTKSGEYKRITRGPIPLTVTPLPKGEELRVFEPQENNTGALRQKEILGKDIVYIKESPGRLRPKGAFVCKQKVFIIIQILPLAAFISVWIMHRRKKRLQNDVRYARRLRAPLAARKNLRALRQFLQAKDTARFFDALFKTLQEYLGDKFHLSSAGITSNVVEELRNQNVDKAVLDKISDCFNSCDSARYAPSAVSEYEMFKNFELLQEIIDTLESKKT
ncbi:MAG: BatD family protein [Candidatus Omnitrophota bacterium]